MIQCSKWSWTLLSHGSNKREPGRVFPKILPVPLVAPINCETNYISFLMTQPQLPFASKWSWTCNCYLSVRVLKIFDKNVTNNIAEMCYYITQNVTSSRRSMPRGAKQLVVVRMAATFSGPRVDTFSLRAATSVLNSSPSRTFSTTTTWYPGKHELLSSHKRFARQHMNTVGPLY